ncbi:MAG: HAMP domain-containing histidine kinase [Bdellovibrionales bacterium]|nr:HAMP domain-containing histidine kinase [Bdellovibrionales bacterium]
MLEYLDQLAFSALLLLSQIVGTPDIPKDPNPDWQIVQPWTELPDKTYWMSIQSHNLGQHCKNNPGQTVVLNNPYMGVYELYGDSRLIETNSLKKRWQIGSMFLDVNISCKKLSEVKVLKINFYSYLKYFAVLHSYPRSIEKLPFYYFFPKYLYVLSASACLFLGIVGLTIIYRLLPLEEVISYVLEDLLFMGVMLMATSEIFGGASIEYCHASVVMGLWGGIVFFFAYLIKPKQNYLKYVVLVVLYVSAYLAIDYRNLMQSLIYLPVLPALVLLTYLIIRDIKLNPSTMLDKFILSLILYFGFMTSYLSYVHRTGVSVMALLVICISTFKFRKIVREVNAIIFQMQDVAFRLNAEVEIAKNLYFQKEKYREILHDIKSPVTSLSFAVALPEDKIRAVITRILSQLNFVLSKLEVHTDSIDWFAVNVLNMKLESQVDNFVSIYKNVNFSILTINGSNENQIFCNDVDYLSIFNELINNSLKHSVGLKKIEIVIDADSELERMRVTYKDDGSGQFQNLDMLGYRGFSSNGTGTGLSSIKRKVESWGGKINFKGSGRGFYCEFSLKKKG